MAAALLPEKIVEHHRKFSARDLNRLKLSIARRWATIDAGISARGRSGQPANAPTPIVVGARRRVWKTAMGHAQ
jgi:hypothetical protein